jgi:DNA polymerase III epsilon subunit-like protein
MVRALLIFDTETTGLPRFVRGRRGFPPPTSSSHYAGSRVVSVAWLVVRASDHVVLREGGGLIRPEGFAIPPEAQAVHGISTEHATAQGEPFGAVAERFVAELQRCDALCGHNVGFDVHVLAAELALRGMPSWQRLAALPQVCTLALARQSLRGVISSFKLGVVYEALFGCDAAAALGGKLHDAAVDTVACYRCLTRLAPAPDAFSPGNWRVSLLESDGAWSDAERGARSAPESRRDSDGVASDPERSEGVLPACPPGPCIVVEWAPEEEQEAGPVGAAGSGRALTEVLLRSATVRCETLGEVAAVVRGAASWAQGRYAGHAIVVRPSVVVRRGEEEHAVAVQGERVEGRRARRATASAGLPELGERRAMTPSGQRNEGSD